MTILEVSNLMENWSIDDRMKLFTVVLSKITGSTSLIKVLKFYEEWVNNQ